MNRGQVHGLTTPTPLYQRRRPGKSGDRFSGSTAVRPPYS